MMKTKMTLYFTDIFIFSKNINLKHLREFIITCVTNLISAIISKWIAKNYTKYARI